MSYIRGMAFEDITQTPIETISEHDLQLQIQQSESAIEHDSIILDSANREYDLLQSDANNLSEIADTISDNMSQEHFNAVRLVINNIKQKYHIRTSTNLTVEDYNRSNIYRYTIEEAEKTKKTIWQRIKDFFAWLWNGIKNIINKILEFLGLKKKELEKVNNDVKQLKETNTNAAITPVPKISKLAKALAKAKTQQEKDKLTDDYHSRANGERSELEKKEVLKVGTGLFLAFLPNERNKKGDSDKIIECLKYPNNILDDISVIIERAKNSPPVNNSWYSCNYANFFQRKSLFNDAYGEVGNFVYFNGDYNNGFPMSILKKHNVSFSVNAADNFQTNQSKMNELTRKLEELSPEFIKLKPGVKWEGVEFLYPFFLGSTIEISDELLKINEEQKNILSKIKDALKDPNKILPEVKNMDKKDSQEQKQIEVEYDLWMATFTRFSKAIVAMSALHNQQVEEIKKYLVAVCNVSEDMKTVNI